MSARAVAGLGRAAPAAGEIDLLRAAWLPPDEAAQAWRSWRSERDVDSSHWRSHALLPAVSANLTDGVLGDEASVLRGLRKRAWLTNQMRRSSLAAAIALLEPLDRLPVVTKGALLASEAYPAAGLRTMGDVDLVVGADQFDDAVDLLVDGGWQPGDEFDHQPFVHAGDLVDSCGTALDLHRWIMFPRHSRIAETSWLERSMPHRVDGVACARFAWADELVLTVVHGITPATGHTAARWPLDVAHLIDRFASETLWHDVTASAGELGVGRPLAAGLRLCRDVLRVEVPADVIGELQELPFDRLLSVEWEMKRRGKERALRSRQYVDTSRLQHRRPTPIGYASMRLDAARRGGGLRSIITRRVGKAATAVRSRRLHRSSW